MRKISAKEKSSVGIVVSTKRLTFLHVEHAEKKFIVLEKKEYALNQLECALNEIKTFARNSPCFLGLSHRLIIIKNLFFSQVFREKEIVALLTANSESYFNQSPNNIAFDFEFLNFTKQQLRVIASKRESIETWRSLFLKNNLNLRAISLDALAVEKYLKYFQLIREEEVYALFMRHDDELLQLVIVEGFVRFIATSLGANDLATLKLEMIKFLRLYESQNVPPISHILILGIEGDIQDLKNSFVLPVTISSPSEFNLIPSVNYILPFGMILPC